MLRVVLTLSLPLDDQLRTAVSAIRDGLVVAFPTDTLYGLAVDPRSSEALRRLMRLKGRDETKTIGLVAADAGQVSDLVHVDATSARVASQFWPGPLTLLLPARGILPASVVGENGLVGVRVPRHPVALALARLAGHALTATSANASGQPATADPDEVARQLPGVDVLVDAGLLAGGAASTIVDVTGTPARLVREGAVPWDRVLESVGSAAPDSTSQ